MWAIKSAQPVPESRIGYEPTFLGRHGVFFSVIPYVLAHGIQEHDIRIALIVATAVAGFLVAAGLILYFSAFRRIPLYLLDSAILVCVVVQLGVSYREEYKIARCFDFITNSALAGLSLLSILFRYPFTLQHIRESVPRQAWRHPHVMSAAYITTAAFSATFTINCMLYLIPVAQDVWWDRMHALTIVFKVLLPCVFYFAATLFTWFIPFTIQEHLECSQGFDGIPPGAASAVQRPVLRHNPIAV